MKAKMEAANKAAAKLDEVDLSHVFQSTAKKSARMASTHRSGRPNKGSAPSGNEEP